MQTEEPVPDDAQKRPTWREQKCDGSEWSLLGAREIPRKSEDKNSVIREQDVVRRWPEPTSCKSLGDAGTTLDFPSGWDVYGKGRAENRFYLCHAGGCVQNL